MICSLVVQQFVAVIIRESINCDSESVNLWIHFIFPVQYQVLWYWVNANCPVGISQAACQGCSEYSITMCQADADTCLSYQPPSGNDIASTCPYSICRMNIVQYIHDNVIW